LRLLYVVSDFSQRTFGLSESVRLMARRLYGHGVGADVLDRGQFVPNVHDLEVLPAAPPTSGVEAFSYSAIGLYDAILHVGPWQNPIQAARMMSIRNSGQPVFYLPRGGLARIEFSRPRDLKKFPYFFLIERRLLRASNGVIYSSLVEQSGTSSFARRAAPEHVIPDIFEPPSQSHRTSAAIQDGPVVFSFLAGIRPRKGLLPLISAFITWSKGVELRGRVRLRIGGSALPGSESYLAEARRLATEDDKVPAISFEGGVTHECRREFYRNTDILVVPSLFESYCLVVLEALAEGCVVVAAPNLGVLEFLPPNGDLIVSEGLDQKSLIAALEAALLRVKADRHLRREGIIRYAGDAIEAINAEATRRWLTLLSPSA